MARPKGTKYIKTPEKMWELFEAYKKKVKDNPRINYDFVGKDGIEVERKLERPLTMEGFECYCYDNACSVHQYFENRDGRYEDYVGICTRIRKEIREDQIEGGMVGQYNPSITQRLNGLTDKSEQSITGNVSIFNGINLDVEADDSAGQDSET